MAEVIAGIGTSHVPSIGAAVDNGETDTPYWKPLFDGYVEARRWMAEADPDITIVVYNDHASNFFLDTVPTFALGTAEEFKIADEGFGPRPVPVVRGDPELSWHLVESLIQDEFDITICQEMVVDHGLTVPLSILCSTPTEWPTRVIPLAVNMIQYPQPTALRCYKLGQALRRALDSYEEDVRVLVLGTGGMSHQLQGERAGFINSEFDRMFLDKLEHDPKTLAEISRTTYLREAGSEGVELIMWLVMRAALNDQVSRVHTHYHVPASNTAAGLVIYENG